MIGPTIRCTNRIATVCAGQLQLQMNRSMTTLLSTVPSSPLALLDQTCYPLQVQNNNILRLSSSSSSSQQQRLLSSKYSPSPLDAFRDPVDRQTRSNNPVGRSWSVTELRRKSYQDLHKLWYVLYKERNMLLTEQQLSRRRQLLFPQPERFYKVRKSMGAIKQVLGERKREKVAAHLASQMEKSMMAESQEQMEEVEMETSIELNKKD
jgi:large subunit ribosomal protein L47